MWINHDNDLVDATITYVVAAKHGQSPQKKSEVIHSTQKHPFLTVEKGFTALGQVHSGMHIVGADGSIGTVTT